MHASPAAIEQNRRQVHYDRLHHASRLEHFQNVEQRLQEGWSRFDLHTLVKQSEMALADSSGMIGLRSVDLEDTEYLKELDAWDACIQ